MRAFRSVHLLALGVWVGAMVFFSFVVAPRVFMATRAVCPACSDGLPAEDAVAVCAVCAARHHDEHAGPCAILGCPGQAEVGAAAPPLEGAAPGADSRWSRVFVREDAPAGGAQLWRLEAPGERERARGLERGSVSPLPFPAAGDAQNAFFGPYYSLGFACGLLALATVWALPGWRVRTGLLAVGLLLCAAGMVFLGQADEALRARNAVPGARAEAQATFDAIHQWSVAANVAMLLLGAAALAHAGWRGLSRPSTSEEATPAPRASPPPEE